MCRVPSCYKQVTPNENTASFPGRVVNEITSTKSIGERGATDGTGDQHAPGHVGRTPAEVPPPPPERYRIEVTISKSTYEKLRHAQDLLSHALPSGDLAQVLDRALDELVTKLEKRKLGAATGRPRQKRASIRKRHVHAQVRHAVWERDKGRCTFVSSKGHRCNARKLLEFDHVNPVARGGAATVEGVRLRCRAHNQYEAERTFGAGFMRHQRELSRSSAVSVARSAQSPCSDDS